MARAKVVGLTPEAHVPTRTCIGCRRTVPQSALVRCVIGPEGPVVHRTAPGRGAWLCSTDCLSTAIGRRAFDRAWRRSTDRAALEALGPVVRTALAARPEESHPTV